jgi:membrane protein DedA with SNARE-associated domain
MSIEHLISQFGYPALILGLLLEGETVLVLAAFMAHRGYFNLPTVILIAWLVSFASDQFFFWLGRLKGSQVLERRPDWQPRVEKAKTMLGRNSDLLFLSIRFMYGFRTILPFVIGMSGYDPRRFAILNLIGSLFWALAFGLAGKLIGRIMSALFEDVRENEPLIIAGIVLAGVCAWTYFQYSQRTKPDRE